MKKSLLWLLVVVMAISMVATFSLAGCKEAAAEEAAAEEEVVEEEVAEEEVAEGDETGTFGDLKSLGEVGEWEPVAEGEGKGVIALMWTTADIPIVNAQKVQNERIAALNGYETIYFNCNWDATVQSDQIETAIEMGVDGMIICVTDEKAIVPSLLALKDAGIPVVAEDGGPIESADTVGLIASYVAADNFRAGEMAGEYIAWRLGGVGKVGLTGYESIKPGRDRTNGVMNVLKHYPNIEIAAYGEGASVPQGLEVMEDFIQRVPDMNAVYAVNDPFGEGCYQAIVAAGKEDQIFITANDGDPAALDMMKESEGKTYSYISAQWPQIMGVVAMENLIAAMEGRDEDILSNVDQQGAIQAWPTFLVAPFPITLETMDNYPSWDTPIDWREISPYPKWWE